METKENEIVEIHKDDPSKSIIIQSDFKENITQKDARQWISTNIIQNNDFRSRYLGKLGIQTEKKSDEKLITEESKIEEDNKELQIEKSYQSGDYIINFFQKTDDQIRKNYLDKLISNKILRTVPSKKQQSLIIFDWDDTLLCTTFLGSLGFIDLDQQILDQLKPLDDSASKLLTIAASYGEMYIITNAASGWVEYSSKLFLPKVNDTLIKFNISIISARSGYENMFPGDSSKWKVEAFLEVKKKYDESIITNIICLGDSHIELDAGHHLAKQFHQALIKTIKFRENPKPEELVKQQELVCDKFEQIYMNFRNLTIRLEKKSSNSNGISTTANN